MNSQNTPTAGSESRTLWYDGIIMPAPPALTSSMTADVCVVGAGIVGMTTAYFLARRGARVVVVDRGGIGSGETGRTTAHLSNALDHLYADVESDIGVRGIRLAAESHAVAINVIETVLRSERIACDFARVDGYLCFAPGESPNDLEREYQAATRARSPVEWVAAPPIRSFGNGPCLRFRNQAQFHPLKYLAGLAMAFARHGGRIFCGTPVTRVQGGSPCQVATAAGHSISAGSVVIATNSPIHENLLVHLKQGPYRTYVVAADIARGALPVALYWDTADPFHYVRIHPGSRGRDIVIIGGEDHRVGENGAGSAHFDALESWARARFPIGRITHRWSGQVMESADGVGLIGHDLIDQPNVYFSTGDSGLGMTHGTIAGMLITDLISGRRNPWRDLYDPTRVPVQTTDFYQENLDVLWHYAEWLTSGDVGTRSAIGRGEGAVVRDRLAKIAVYQPEHGPSVEMSAICPHLGCIVQWNAVEKEWHCPCHGSRFDREGTNLNGPAAVPLARIDGAN